MDDQLVPTTRLRFVERPKPIEGTSMVDTRLKIRVLQQWWEPADMLHPSAGEWRDVPLEAE